VLWEEDFKKSRLHEEVVGKGGVDNTYISSLQHREYG
jgi:hypothetical protein